MNSVRKRVLIGIKPYQISEHKDLAAFCVDSEEFEDWDEIENNNGNLVSDFNEVVCVVEKDWLYEKIKNECDTDNPLHYLQSVYTSDESYDWFIDAKEQGKLVMVSFS